jgi:uncharacterized membrane protein YphA (DoxX/SURF4 family)
MLKGVTGEVDKGMFSLHQGLGRKSKDASAYLLALFVFVPGVLLILGLVSHVPLALVGGLLAIYYLVAIFAVIAQGAGWLDRHF